MTRDEGVAMIQEQLSFRTTLSSSIVRAMKLAQNTLELAPTKPWFLISEDSFANTTANEERVPVPVDFISEVDDATLKYRPAGYPTDKEVDLVKDEYDVLRKNFKDSVAGTPQAYALLNGYFRFFPLPAAVYQVRLIYYKQAVVLDTNVENAWLKNVPLLLLGSAGLIMAAAPLRNKVAADTFSQWVATGTRLLAVQTSEREMANRVMQIGGPHA